ncbi:peroxiredoxin family protein [Nitrospina sp. 32_T5]|uniref:peroxiredoxin family protein n=1 Tax=unclassified Nitrospina TaxID=2638683 RepID=UPI003F95F660
MKSTGSKKRNFTLIKKYAAIYIVLFAGALMAFVSHYYETPVTPEEVQVASVQTQERSAVGYMAPGFTVRNLKGNRVSLADFEGQVVILNLWATWCGPCRIEMPGFENLYRRFRSEGLTILAVSLDKDNDQKVRDFVEEYGLSFPVLLDAQHKVESRYNTFTIPTTYVIDRKGRIVAVVDGAKNWEAQETFDALELLLKPS